SLTDEPSNAELQRQIDRNHKDFMAALDALGQRMERYVLEQVYRAEMKLMLERLDSTRAWCARLEEAAEEDRATVKKDRETARAEEAANRRTARNGIYAALGTFVAALALAAFSAWIKVGGH